MNVAWAEKDAVVSIESPRPTRAARHEIGPGVIERTTCQLLVRYSMELPPVFNLAVSRWTGLIREVGYAIVGGIEKVRWKLSMFEEQSRRPERPGHVRPLLRRIRAALAIRLLLPRFQVRSESLPSDAWYELPSPGFEASRRVFEFRAENARRTGLLVCHVFAERHDEAASRLLNQFATIAGRGVGVKQTLYDGESQLWLQGKTSTPRRRRRRYWEVIIGSPERFSAVRDAPAGRISSGQFVQSGLMLEGMSADTESMDVKMPKAEYLQGVVERSAVDWDFVTGEIRTAVDKGEPLGDEFIQGLAERRLEHARREFSIEEPGATLESSLEIVRNAVALHQMAAASETSGDVGDESDDES